MASAAPDKSTHVAKLATGKVLVAGDSMLDRYWFGDVERISPEAPVPVMAVNREEIRLGGAANVAGNVVALGGAASLLSIVGEDKAAAEIDDLLGQAGIVSELVVCEALKTTVKLRLLGRNQQLLRADFENAPSDKGLQRFGARFYEKTSQAGAVILSDYGKGSLKQSRALIASARAQGVAVLVDPKGSDFSRYTGASLITPNLSEFQAVAGEVSEIDEIHAAAEKLMATHQIDALLITLSERGMVLCEAGKAALVQSARAREVYDVTGAGDTVIAVAGLALAAGFALPEAVNLANHAAGVAVTRLGTAIVTPGELIQSLSRH